MKNFYKIILISVFTTFTAGVGISASFAETLSQVSLDAKAYGLFARGNYDAAYSLYKSGIARYKNYAPLYDGLGQMYFEQKSYVSAYRNFKNASRLEPDNALYKIHSWNALWVPAQEKLYSAYSKFSQALASGSGNSLIVKNIDRVRQFDRKNLEVITDFYAASESPELLKGNTALLSKNYAQASKLYNSAIKKNKDIYKAYNNLGIVALQQGDKKQAMKYLLKAAALDPKSGMAYNNLGVIFYRANNIPKSKYYFQASLKCYDRYSVALNNIGVIELQEAENKINAIKLAIDGYMQTNTPAIPALKLGGDVYATLGQTKPLLDVFSKNVDVFSENSDLLRRYGDFLNDSGDWFSALDAYKKASNLNSKDPYIYLGMARAYEKKSDPKNAIVYYQTAIRTSPSTAVIYKYYGQFLVSQNKTAEARGVLRKYLEINPETLDRLEIEGTLRRIG